MTGAVAPEGSAERLRQRPWTDPRLVVGVLLVVGATVLGGSVVAAADDTRPYWALSRDVEAGDPVRRADLVESRARVDDAAAATLLRTDRPLPARLASSQWSRAGRRGALVSRSDLAPAGAGSSSELPLPVTLGAAPDDLRGGERVDVWVGPAPESDEPGARAVLALEDVLVVRAGSTRGAGGARTVLVDVGGRTLDGSTMAQLTSRHLTIVRRS